MVLIANDQDTLAAAHRLKGILQSLQGGPGGADVKTQRSDVAVACRHLAHEAASDLAKVICPLVDDFAARRDHDHTIDLVALDQRAGNHARRDRLPRPRCSVDQEVAINPLINQPAKRLRERLLLPRPQSDHAASFS